MCWLQWTQLHFQAEVLALLDGFLACLDFKLMQNADVAPRWHDGAGAG